MSQRGCTYAGCKGVVLGLVSSKTPVLESLDGLRRRAEEAAAYIDLDRLAISPQCGFASSAAGNPLSEADERAKLRRVVEAARAIWRVLDTGDVGTIRGIIS